MSLESPNIRSLLNLRWLQHLQDEVSKNAGSAVGILDPQQEKYTDESNCSTLCGLIRSSEEGRRRCQESEAKGAEKARCAAQANEQAPIYVCHAGLMQFAAAVLVDGQHIGTVFGGQVLLRHPDATTLERFRSLARELGLRDMADELAEAAVHIPVLSQEKLRLAADLVSLTANSISQIACQAWQADRQSEVRRTLMEPAGATALEAVLATVTSDLRVALGAEHAVVFLKDLRGFFVLAAADTPMPESIGTDYYEPMEGLTGFVGATGLPLRVNDVQDQRELSAIAPNLRWAGKIRQGQAAQFLGIALKNRANDVVGVLRFTGKTSGRFTDEDEWLVTAYAELLAKVMERSELAAETAIDEEHAYDRYLQLLGED
jgi:ligand-binding sensor protein